MTDNSDPIDDDVAHGDEAAGKERLDELGEEIEATRRRAEDDLEVGGQRRTFADQGVREQVAEHGDTEHPTGDGTGEDA